MPLTSQQIVVLASQIAKAPGMISQAGQFLNAVLQDLCSDYDLDIARSTYFFNFNSATGQGAGPYKLPYDYLRTQVIDGKDNFFYTINGVPYPLIQVTLAEYHWLVQTPGFQSYPYYYATDLNTTEQVTPVVVSPPFTLGDPTSPLGSTRELGAQEVGTPMDPVTVTTNTLYVWPPASGSYPAALTYFRTMPDIAHPETSTTIPWFPNSEILIRGVAGRMMQISGDNRVDAYLGEDPERYPMGFKALLNAWLKNVKDREGAVTTVGLDRRRFGRPFDRLKNTKTIGW